MYISETQENETKQGLYSGSHLILEFWQCQNLNSEKIVKKALIDAVAACNAELLSLNIHRFEPAGISGIAALKESHISIHTWPELKYAALDIFTCGTKVRPYKALETLKKYFKPKSIDIIEIKRGVKI